jgi:Ca2+-binding RTX toxin-like protein
MAHTWWRRVLSFRPPTSALPTRNKRRNASAKRRVVSVEQLESRLVLSVSSDVTAGVLTVTSDAADAISITSSGGKVQVNGADPDSGEETSASITSIQITGGPGANTIDLSGVTGAVFTGLTTVSVSAGDGGDTITGSGLAEQLSGESGDDTIFGGSGADTITGGLGSDMIRGDGGDDELIANDTIADTIVGGTGTDSIAFDSVADTVLDANPALIGTRLAQLFDELQIEMDSQVFAKPAPLVGSEGSRGFVQDDLEAILNGFVPSGATIADAEADLTAVFGSLLVGSITHSGNDGDSEITFTIQLHRSPLPRQAIGIDLALPGLPVQIDGTDVTSVDVGWDATLKLGVNDSAGFFLDTTPATGTEFTVSVSANELNLVDKDATIGLLRSTVSDDTDAPSSFTGTYAVRLSEADDRLTFPEFAGIDLTSTLTGVADINLKAQAEFDPSSPINPRLRADINIDWSFAGSDPESTDPYGDVPSVVFNNVQFDLGAFMGGFAAPIVTRIQAVTKPMQPLLDVLLAPIPVVSDLAGTPITFASMLGPTANAFFSAMNVVNTLEVPATGDNVYLPLGSFATTDPRVSTADLDQNSEHPEGIEVTIQRIKDNASDEDEAGGGGNEKRAKVEAFVGATFDFHDGLHFPILEDPTQAFGLFIGRDAILAQLDLPKFVAGFGIEQSFMVWPLVNVGFEGGVTLTADIKFGYDTNGLHTGNVLNGFFIYDTANGAPISGSNPDNPEISVEATLAAKAFLGFDLGIVSVEAGARGGIEGVVDFDLHDDNMDGRVRGSEIETIFRTRPQCIFDMSGSIDAFLELYITAELELDFGLFSVTITLLDESLELLSVNLVSFDVGCPNITFVPQLGTVAAGVLTLNMGPNATDANFGGHFDIPSVDEVYVVSHVAPKPGDPAGERIKVAAFGYEREYTGITSIVANGGSGNDAVMIQKGVLASANVQGGAGNDRLSYLGSATATLSGGDGDDALGANAGNDVLSGGDGNDKLDGRNGNDSVSGGLGNDSLVGGQGNDTLDGSGDADVIQGGAGNDSITAGTGDDKIQWVSGDGDDTIDAGTGSDLMSLRTSGADDVIALTANGAWANVVATNSLGTSLLQLFGAETIAITTASGADTVTVSDLTGTGIQQVNTDVSTYGNIDASADTAIVEGTPNPDNLRYVANDQGGLDSDGLAYGVSLVSMEVVHDTAVLRGGPGDDTLGAGTGVEDIAMVRLEGESGNDFLTGTTKGDTLNGGTGNDTLTGGTGADTFIGGTGNDRVIEARNSSFTLTDTTLQIGSEGTDSLSSVEEAFLTGGNASNSFHISAWTGYDQLDGADGGDSYTIDLNGVRGATAVQDTGAGGVDSATVNHAGFDAPYIASGIQISTGNESVSYDSNLEQLHMAQAGADATYSGQNTLSVTPSPETALEFTGRPRTAPADPINVLNLDLTLVTNPTLTVTGPSSGVLTSQGHGPVTYDEFEYVSATGRPFDLIVDAASTGTSASRGDGAADDFLAVVEGDTLRIFADGALVFSTDASAVGSVTIRGSSDNDTLVLDNSGVVFPGTIHFDGVSGTVDTLEIIGGGSGSGYYVPGSVNGSGTIGYTSGDGVSQLITFVNLTPVVVHDMTSYTFVTPNSADVIAVDSPAAGQNRITGSSGGTAFESITFYNVTNFTIEAGSNDSAGSPDDSITIDSSGLVATGLQNFVINTGIGNDTLTIQSESYSLPVAGGSISFNGGGGSDSIVASADIGFTLFDTGLVSTSGGLISLASVDQASLTGGASDNTFTVSNWTKVADLDGGGGSDTLISVNNASFTLSDASFARSTGGSFTLLGFEIAEISGGTSANTFTIGGWTGAGTLDGLGGTDTIISIRDTDFTLSDTSLSTASGATWVLAGIESAFLTGGASANTFTVSGWTGSLVVDGQGGSDTIVSSNDADFALTDGSLDRSTGESFALSSIEVANLTGGVSNNIFTVSGWTGTGTLGGGSGSDTVASTNNSNFTLTDSSLVVSGGANITLASIEVAKLTGGVSANSFTVTGWTGTGTMDGLTGTDTIVAAEDADFTLGDSELAVSGGATLTLKRLEIANLTGGNSDNRFTVSGWSGTGTLDGASGTDTVAASNDANFTLADGSLARSDLGTLTLAGIENAELTGGSSANSFTVTNWTGTGALDGGAASDTLVAANDTNFTLTDSSLIRAGLGTLSLAGIEVANLTGGSSGNQFNVSGWSGTGTMDAGTGTDTLNATNDTDFTLADGSLARSGSGTITLSGFETANLTGGSGSNHFVVTGWTGTGSLDGTSGSDTVVAANNTSFTLTDALLARTGLSTLGLVGIEAADLSGGTGDNTFTVTGWTGTGTLSGANGNDTVIASNDADFILADSSLARTGRGTISLNTIETANLTGGGSSNAFTVSGWTGNGTIDGDAGSDLLVAMNDTAFNLSDSSLARTGFGTLTLAGIESANLTGGTGANSFTVTNWTGTGSLDGSIGSDTLVAVNDTDFTLSDGSLARAGFGTLGLAGIEVANLTGGTGGNSFTVSGWTGTGNLDAGIGSDTLVASNDTDFTLADGSLARAGAGSLNLSGFETALLTGGVGDNQFTVTGWTGAGTLAGAAGSDTVIASNDANFTLTDSSLGRSGLGTLSLSSIEAANLSGGASTNTFDISSWTGTGTLEGAGGNDVVAASNDLDFVLADGSLARSGLGTVLLSHVEIANLTGGAGDNSFTVSGWTGTGSMNGGLGNDRIVATNDANFTLSDGSLARTGLGTLTLTSIERTNLTGGPLSNSFTVTGWTGTGTLDGASGADSVVATNDADFTITDGSLARTGFGTLSLASIEVATLSGGPSANTFTVSGWTGTGLLDAAGGSDTLVANNDADFVLADGSLSRSGSGVLTILGFESANLTGGAGANQFDVSGWTGTGTINAGLSTDTIVAVNDVDFTVTDSTLVRTGLGTLSLLGFERIDLTGGASANMFTVTGWTGTGSLSGAAGSDSVVASNDSDFVLSDGSLGRSGHGSLTLGGIEIAILTGGAGANQFAVSGWTGTGTLNGGTGSDVVVAANDADFSLSNGLLARTGHGSLSLSAIEQANLTGGASGNTFDVSGWTGTGTVDGSGGSDTVLAANDADFTLTDNSLARTGAATLGLTSVEVADLTGGTDDNAFTVSGWTGTGTLDGGAGSDSVVATNDTHFTVTDSALDRTGLGSLSLAGIEVADLTGGAGANTFTVTGWTGTGTLDAASGSDTLVAVNDVDFTLTNSSLSRTGFGTLTLAGFEIANLTGGTSANEFTVSGWTGTGSLAGAAGSDTVIAANDTSFALADGSLSRTGLGTLTLSAIEVAELTGGPGGNAFTVGNWSGTGTLAGAGGNDTVIAATDTDFVLRDDSLARLGLGTLSLLGIEQATLAGGASSNTLDLSGWTGTGSFDGGSGSDTIQAANDANFTLADGSLARSGAGTFGLSGIEAANLIGGASDNTFIVSGWTGTGTIDGSAGSDTLRAVNDGDFTLVDNALTRSNAGTLSLQHIEVCDLTGGAGDNSFSVTGWTGVGTFDGLGGNDSLTAANDGDFGLDLGTLARSGLGTLTLSNIEAVDLVGGPSANQFTVNRWTGNVTMNGGAGNDSFDLGGAPDSLAELIGTFVVLGDADTSGDSLVVHDAASLASAAYSISATAVVRSGGPTINYAGIEQLSVHGGSAGNLIIVSSTLASTPLLIFAGTGDDLIVIDSNGPLPGGIADDVQSAITLDGEAGNDDIIIEDSSDTTGDAVQVTPTTVGLTGTLFSNGGSVTYSSIRSVTLNLGSGTTGDIVSLKPSGTTSFFVNGNNPSASPGDSLNLNFLGISGHHLATTGSGAGTWTFDNAQPVSYTGIEQVNRAEFVVTSPDAGVEPRVHVLDAATRRERFNFLAYDATYRGGVRVAVGDVNSDGVTDIITAPGKGNRSEVRVFDGTTGRRLAGPLGSLFPYGTASKAGVFVAAGDVNGDGYADIITGLDNGGEIRIISGRDASLLGSIVAFTTRFRAGVRVAAADVTGDGKADIIAAPGGGGRGEVRVFDGVTLRQLAGSRGSFLAVGSAVIVAAGDVNGDGFADIVTSTGGRKEIRVFDGRNGTQIGSFLPNLSGFKGEVRLAIADVNGDGKGDIITGAGPGARPLVSLFDAASLRAFDTILADFPISGLGIFVAAGGLKNS